MMTTTSSPGLSRNGLTILLLGQLLPLIDFSIVNVGLEAIAKTFHASSVQLELVIAAYGIAFAISLAMGGRFGDNYGRRRIFTLGVTVFGIASLMCGLASSVWMLLAARVLQGIGAALIVPQILATIHVSLQGRNHARAIGLYGGIGGLAFIIGQVAGGFLIAADIAGYGWRSVFLINIPLCLLVMALARAIPETRKAQRVAVDLPGTLLLAASIGCLLIALALGPLLHWAWQCVALLAAVPLLLAQLWQAEKRLERRQGAPLLPPALIRLQSIRFGLIIAVIFFACWSGFMFVVALTLQAGLGMTPFQSGNAFIALGAAYFIASLYSTRMVERCGTVFVLIGGCAIQISGLVALIATFNFGWQYTGILLLVPATALIGFGQAFIVSSFYRIGLADIAKEDAGAGSAVLSTVQQAAFGLGPLVLGTVYSEMLHRHASYKQAVVAALALEVLLMLILVVRAFCSRHRAAVQPE